MKPAPTCTKCSAPAPVAILNTGQFGLCPGCDSPLRIDLYPAFFREAKRGATGEAIVIDSDASCFYHPRSRAAVICSACGRFLCGLCDLEIDGVHFCAPCLKASNENGKIGALENRRPLNDVLAFQLSIFGLVIFYFSLIAAPISIYFAIKHWKTPGSLVQGTSKWRFVTAIILSSLQLLAWIVGIGYFLTR
jgi:hypothetical protein